MQNNSNFQQQESAEVVRQKGTNAVKVLSEKIAELYKKKLNQES